MAAADHKPYVGPRPFGRDEKDLFFGREIEQTITARDIEATADQIERVRTHKKLTARSLQSESFVTNRTNKYAIR